MDLSLGEPDRIEPPVEQHAEDGRRAVNSMGDGQGHIELRNRKHKDVEADKQRAKNAPVVLAFIDDVKADLFAVSHRVIEEDDQAGPPDVGDLGWDIVDVGVDVAQHPAGAPEQPQPTGQEPIESVLCFGVGMPLRNVLDWPCN